MSAEDNFDELFAEITADENTTATTEPVSQGSTNQTEAKLVSKQEETLPDIQAKPETKRMYKTIPDDQKISVEGTPCDALVYPAGYVRLKWPAGRITNQCILYRDQYEELRDFFLDEARRKAWEEKALAAGLRLRGEPREE